ncbi:Imm51 family immunity protein [Hymenobacter sp.]|jgi:hypothetical protein|uniref:Imm51 family immunity protein n=1 Tax=Hymenobacter sp. TaxID=1898978 RepID=UPI002ED888BC
MKNLNKLRLPKSLPRILAEESMWEEDTYAPFHVSIHDHTGEVLYEVYLAPTNEPELLELNAELAQAGFEVNGYGWEKAIRALLAKKAPHFNEQVQSDSDTEACVLYTTTEADFRQLLDLLWELVENPQEIKTLS